MREREMEKLEGEEKKTEGARKRQEGELISVDRRQKACLVTRWDNQVYQKTMGRRGRRKRR